MLGLEFTVDPAGISEEALEGEEASEHVERLAREKAGEVAGRHAGALVLAGDTVVEHRGGILGKPADEDQAVEMLVSLSGRTHTVYTGLALAYPGPRSGSVRCESGVSVTRVTFRPFDENEARAYVATGEPMDKAGAYGIQGMGAALVQRLEGDYFTVAGLPIPLLMDLLERAGWPYAFGRLRVRKGVGSS